MKTNLLLFLFLCTCGLQAQQGRQAIIHEENNYEITVNNLDESKAKLTIVNIDEDMITGLTKNIVKHITQAQFEFKVFEMISSSKVTSKGINKKKFNTENSKLIAKLYERFFGKTSQEFVDVNNVMIKDKTIKINFEATTESFETQIEEGDYMLVFEGLYKSISIKRNANLSSKLSMGESSLIAKEQKEDRNILNIPLKFDKNTVYTIAIITNDDVTKTYKFYTKSNWEWITTFGVNSTIFSNRAKFIPRQINDTLRVVKIKSSSQMNVVPSIMFTFMNTQKDHAFGITAGLGFDFDNITAFTGISYGIGNNIVLTGGVSLTSQVVPNSDFIENQIIESSISTDILNNDYYRLNPFIGISYRFDKNPFIKGGEK